jgi:hypothetical protein
MLQGYKICIIFSYNVSCYVCCQEKKKKKNSMQFQVSYIGLDCICMAMVYFFKMSTLFGIEVYSCCAVLLPFPKSQR